MRSELLRQASYVRRHRSPPAPCPADRTLQPRETLAIVVEPEHAGTTTTCLLRTSSRSADRPRADSRFAPGEVQVSARVPKVAVPASRPAPARAPAIRRRATTPGRRPGRSRLPPVPCHRHGQRRGAQVLPDDRRARCERRIREHAHRSVCGGPVTARGLTDGAALGAGASLRTLNRCWQPGKATRSGSPRSTPARRVVGQTP